MADTKLNPYLNFNGNTREAMEFYKAALGGELRIMTFGTFPGAPDDQKDKVMHAMLESGGMTLMASDPPPGQTFQGGDTISLSLSGTDTATLTSYWEKLSAGGQVIMPLEKQMWGDTFGMFKDKFGMQWMINIVAPR